MPDDGAAEAGRARHLVHGLLLALIVLCASGRAFASHDLVFHGDGYTVHMVIGDDGSGRAVVADVYFIAPGDPDDARLARDHWQTDAFDTRQQLLQLRHTDYSGRVPPFTLEVDGEVAVLEIAGQKVRSGFRWQDM